MLVKRLFDFFISLFGLMIFFPLFLLFSVLIKINIGSPVFFRQIRPGKNGISFPMLKFRTMTNERDLLGNLLPDEKRMTKLGRFLRSTSLDELPELWNVLKGDMSLVGPRPLLMDYLPLYSKEQARRHLVKPGITGWAQINGRNNISWNKKFEYDIWYVDNRSFWLDLKILFMTIKKIIAREGISSDGHVTTEKFKGNN